MLPTNYEIGADVAGESRPKEAPRRWMSTSQEDFFAIKFPGEPRTKEKQGLSEQGAMYHGASYSAPRRTPTVCHHHCRRLHEAEENQRRSRPRRAPTPDCAGRAGSAARASAPWDCRPQGAIWPMQSAEFLRARGRHVTVFGWLYQDHRSLKEQVTNATIRGRSSPCHAHDRSTSLKGPFPPQERLSARLVKQSMRSDARRADDSLPKTVYSNRIGPLRAAGPSAPAAALTTENEAATLIPAWLRKQLAAGRGPRPLHAGGRDELEKSAVRRGIRRLIKKGIGHFKRDAVLWRREHG